MAHRAGATLVLACSLTALAACSGGGSKGGETFVTAAPSPAATSVPGSATSTGPVPGNPQPADRVAAERMESLLEQSNSSRGQVASAVQGLAACTLDPHQASATFAAAAQARQSVLTSLAALDVTGLAEGPQLKGLLQQALQHSVEADQGFKAWADELASRGCSRSGATQSSTFAAANASSDQATAAKSAFVAAWNPVATRFGLRQWAAGDI
jgi:hypothetical protein